MNLPKHACALFLTHNEHLSYYETVEQWADMRYGSEGCPLFISEEAKAKCIATNDCWMLQWYPETPVGYHRIAAPTLEELLAFAAEIERQETP